MEIFFISSFAVNGEKETYIDEVSKKLLHTHILNPKLI